MLGVCQKSTNRTFVYIYTWHFEIQEKTLRLFQWRAHPNRQLQAENIIWISNLMFFFCGACQQAQCSVNFFSQIRNPLQTNSTPKNPTIYMHATKAKIVDSFFFPKHEKTCSNPKNIGLGFPTAQSYLDGRAPWILSGSSWWLKLSDSAVFWKKNTLDRQLFF